MNIISIEKRIVDTDVVNDVTKTPQSVITRVVIRFLRHPLNNGDVIDKYSLKDHCTVFQHALNSLEITGIVSS